MAFQDQAKTWFLALIKPNSAQIAIKNLNRQGFDCFLPMEEVVRRRNDRFVSTLRPMFPGYIFVAFDADQGMWRKVNSTYGVTRLVSFGAEPAPVPPGIMAELVRRCDASGKLLPPQHFSPGDHVVLTVGPFAELMAEIEKVTPDRRVWVLLDLMGGKTRVAVNPNHLKVA
ncbi:MAG: transcriptional activator RfaH [Rhodobacteraceae bacterium]|nr:transcriptional activator RfaH [Paracoccaceae bacterium]